ncbi:hypothetical protein [Paenibacillus sp. 1-18]|uniref:hypothetical protein n=1 Tax=Paenibacillus sp. 1-18 TaxID=1333846 RepID=UPI00046E7781|nr:hypothetical protein [Paenibacillus sp. 1-18]
MKKANKQNKIEELAGSYTTPHGMTVTLKRLTRTVQGVRFELETELDDRAMASPPVIYGKRDVELSFRDYRWGRDSLGESKKKWLHGQLNDI